jgi:hypothetical protein
MLTRTLASLARPDTVRPSLLLAALVLGLVGMHTLETGAGTPGFHHVSSTAVASAPTDLSMHVGGQGAGHGDPAPGDVVADSRGGRPGDHHGTSALTLCMALLLAFTGAVLGHRHVTRGWSLGRAPRPGPLPAPTPRERLLVPRFTVMRC